jgi:hypothetical protein
MVGGAAHRIAAIRNEVVEGLTPEAGTLGSSTILGREVEARRRRAMQRPF